MENNAKQKRHRQMSEALPVVALITLSGGLQDAYSYLVRGKVFSNAQTGNIVLMSGQLFEGNLSEALRYLVPLLAFLLGVFAADQIRFFYKESHRIHWRQIVLLGEIALLLVVGFFPSKLDFAANAMSSFACAMQVQAFRKVNGNSYASTMCIGNMRSGAESLSAYFHTRNIDTLKKSGQYFGVILLFGLGAGLGSVLVHVFSGRTIWASCLLLTGAVLLMFIRGECEGSR